MKQVYDCLPKNRKKQGFTLTEILAAVAILVILFSLATVSFVSLQKNLRQRELDSKAEIIYVAAQNRLTELRAAGYDNVFTPGNADGDKGIYKMKNIPSDADEQEDASKRPTLYSVYSEDKETDGQAAKNMLTATSVDIDLWGNNWIIEYDPEGGNIYGVFYSEEEINKDETYRNNVRYKQGRLQTGAKVGYYGGDITRINFTQNLSASIDIINKEKLIVKFACNNPGMGTLRFDITLYDTVTHESYTRTVEQRNMTQLTGTLYTYTWTLDSLLDGEHFYEQTGMYGGHTLQVKLVPSTVGDMLISGQEITRETNSLFADRPSDARQADENTAFIQYGRHLQNLDAETSHLSEKVDKAIMVRDFSFQDDRRDSEDYYSFYGPYFKPIENSNLKSFDGCYHSTSGDLQTVIDSLHIPAVIPGGKSEYTNAGLFASFSGTLKNVYLSNTTVGAGGTVGGLVARIGGSTTIDNCRVYLDNRNGDLGSLARVEDAENVQPWLSGGTVGGLVGTVPSGTSLKLTNSFTATSIASRRYAGGLVGTVVGTLDTNTAYADCYLRSGNYAGGLIGGSTARAGILLKNFYATGFLTAYARAAGIAAGPVTSMVNGYTAVDYTPKTQNTDLYTTAVSGSADSVFYMVDTGLNVTGSLTGTAVFTNDDVKSGKILGKVNPQEKHLTDGFVNGRDQACNPYNLLKGMSLSTYTYPALEKLEHYGDWRSFPDQESLVYYEVYSDGSYKFYGANGTNLRTQDDKAIGSRTAVGDGYAWMLMSKPSEVWTKTVTYANGAPQTLNAQSTVVESELNGVTYYLLPLDIKILNSLPLPVDGEGNAQFYQRIEVSGDEEEREVYYFNPYFAKTAVQASSTPGIPKTISIRTARQLYALSRLYGNVSFATMTSDSVFSQELDVDYGTYHWNLFIGAARPTSQAPIGDGVDGKLFYADYNGGYHTVSNLSIQSDTLYMGMFGYVAPQGSVRNLFLIGYNKGLDKGKWETDDSENRVTYTGGQYFSGGSVKPYIGTLAGVNEGEIDNCAVTGYRLEGYGYLNSVLTMGGFVGLNKGLITDSSTDIRQIKFSNDHSTGVIGGFVGRNEGTISNSYSAGEIAVSYATNSTVTIAGFAAENTSTLYYCYAGVALMPSGNAKAYGFAPASSGITNCLYLDGGTFSYADTLRSFNTSTNVDRANAGGTAISGMNLTHENLAGFGFAKDAARTLFHPETAVAEYPYPAVVHLADGTLVHIGDWATLEKDLGTLGVFYWEYESGGSNAGYHFSYIGTDQGIPFEGTTLCQAHDDGGVITHYGYGYFVAKTSTQEVNLIYNEDKVNLGGIAVIDGKNVGSELEKQMPQYRFVAYETGTTGRAEADKTYLKSAEQNMEWMLSYGEQATYSYTLNPFFANAMNLDGSRIRNVDTGEWETVAGSGKQLGILNRTDETKTKPYEIRSVSQLQYVNWNYGDLSTNYSIFSNNYTDNMASQYPYLTFSRPDRPVPTEEQIVRCVWEQTHDVDAHYEWSSGRLFTPIGSMYDTNGNASSSTEGPVARPYMSYFSSSYDGKDYAVKNISISSPNQCVGVFGLTASANLKNISLYSDQNCAIEGRVSDSWYCLGGLVGFAGAGPNNASNSFENCTVSGYKIIDSHNNDLGWGGGNVGGLVGATNMNITRCSAVTDIEIYFKYQKGWLNIRVGGLAGICRATVSECYAGGSIADKSGMNMQSYVGDGSSLWVGGLVGGVIIREAGTFGDQIGTTTNGLKVINSYSYVTLPAVSRAGARDGFVRSSMPIASNGEMLYTFAVKTNVDVYIINSYCLDTEVQNTDGYSNFSDANKNWNGNVNVNTHDSSAWQRGVYVSNGGRSPYLSYEQMRDGTLQNYLNNPVDTSVKPTKGFGTVTTMEMGNPINGKYTFPGGDTELQNLNYPFPTILTQTDVYGTTVNVHYGRWPKFGMYWDENTQSIDILKDWKSGTDGQKGASYVEGLLNIYSLDGYMPDEDNISFTYETDEGERMDAKDAAAQAVSWETATGGYRVRLEAKKPGTVVVVATTLYQNQLHTAKLTVTVTADLQLTVGSSVESPYEEDTEDVSISLGSGLHLEEMDNLTFAVSVVNRDENNPSAIAELVHNKDGSIFHNEDGSMVLRITGKASGTATVTVKATYSPTWAEEPIEATANVSVRTLPSITLGISDGTDFIGVSVLHTPTPGEEYESKTLEPGPKVSDQALYLFMTCDENAQPDYASFDTVYLSEATLSIGGEPHTLGQNAENPLLFEDEAYSLLLGGTVDMAETENAAPFHYRSLTLRTSAGEEVQQQWTMDLRFGRQGSENEAYMLRFARPNTLWFYSGTDEENPGTLLKSVRVPQGKAPDLDQETLDAELRTSYGKLTDAETPETGKHWVWTLPDAAAITGNTSVFRSAADNVYTVEFDGNFDGWDIESGEPLKLSLTYGTAAAAPENPYIRDGFTFLGWASDAQAETPYYQVGAALLNLAEEHGATVKLYALWRANTATLNLHTGIVGEDDQEVIHTLTADFDQTQGGAAVVLPDCQQTRDGFTFLGWAKTQASTTADYLAGEIYKMDVSAGSQTFDLFAVWQEEKAAETQEGKQDNSLPPQAEEETANPPQPVTQPSEPETQPSEPAAQPGEPETKPSEPAAQPSKPETQSSEPDASPEPDQTDDASGGDT